MGVGTGVSVGAGVGVGEGVAVGVDGGTGVKDGAEVGIAVGGIAVGGMAGSEVDEMSEPQATTKNVAARKNGPNTANRCQGRKFGMLTLLIQVDRTLAHQPTLHAFPLESFQFNCEDYG